MPSRRQHVSSRRSASLTGAGTRARYTGHDRLATRAPPARHGARLLSVNFFPCVQFRYEQTNVRGRLDPARDGGRHPDRLHDLYAAAGQTVGGGNRRLSRWCPSDVFLRLIKMVIGPLVFSTLVVGIAHMGDASSVGRVFVKALGWLGSSPRR